MHFAMPDHPLLVMGLIDAISNAAEAFTSMVVVTSQDLGFQIGADGCNPCTD